MQISRELYQFDEHEIAYFKTPNESSAVLLYFRMPFEIILHISVKDPLLTEVKPAEFFIKHSFFGAHEHIRANASAAINDAPAGGLVARRIAETPSPIRLSS